jgi:hypothetical protein
VMERPILFSGPMVRSILAGNKVQTRRVLKRQHDGYARFSGCDEPEPYIKTPSFSIPYLPKGGRYGDAGDLLWVKETYAIHKKGSVIKQTLPLFEYAEPCGETEDERISNAFKNRMRLEDGYECVYRATQAIDPDFPIHWRPSIFMSRWLSRITLEVVSVRIEQLHKISEEDAIAEGMRRAWGYGAWMGAMHPVKKVPKALPTAREAFRSVWDEINFKRGWGWDVNPFVEVITFRVVSRKAAEAQSEGFDEVIPV